jgi:hypothetical protein
VPVANGITRKFSKLGRAARESILAGDLECIPLPRYSFWALTQRTVINLSCSGRKSLSVVISGRPHNKAVEAIHISFWPSVGLPPITPRHALSTATYASTIALLSIFTVTRLSKATARTRLFSAPHSFRSASTCNSPWVTMEIVCSRSARLSPNSRSIRLPRSLPQTRFKRTPVSRT